MGPIPAILIGLALSAFYHLQIHAAQMQGATGERERWVDWLRNAWDSAQFEMDVSTNVNGLTTLEAVTHAFNRILGSFHGWPNAAPSDKVVLFGTSVIEDEDAQQD